MPAGKMGLVNCPFQMRRNAGALFLFNLMLDVIEDCIPTLRANYVLAKWTLIG